MCITNVLLGSLSLGGGVAYIVGSNTLALKISSKTLFIFYEEEKKKKKSLVIQKKDPRKGGRKSHLKENTRSIVPTVTVTLIPTQTPVVRKPIPFCLPCFQVLLLES